MKRIRRDIALLVAFASVLPMVVLVGSGCTKNDAEDTAATNTPPKGAAGGAGGGKTTPQAAPPPQGATDPGKAP